jgi:hypothetical protein
MSTLGSESIWYKLAIYFYLHFQYNAWFILALIGILFFTMERYSIAINKKQFKRFFFLVNLSIILSLFLSVLWTKPSIVFYILAALGALIQVFAFYSLFKIITPTWPVLKIKLSPIVAKLLILSGLLLLVKILFQLISALPYFADLAFLYKDFVIGYLHWTFLGVISISLFAFLEHFNLIKLKSYIVLLYMLGFIFSEILIFYNAIQFWLEWPSIPNRTLILVIVSALIPMSLGIILFKNLTSEN